MCVCVCVNVYVCVRARERVYVCVCVSVQGPLTLTDRVTKVNKGQLCSNAGVVPPSLSTARSPNH